MNVKNIASTRIANETAPQTVSSTFLCSRMRYVVYRWLFPILWVLATNRGIFCATKKFGLLYRSFRKLIWKSWTVSALFPFDKIMALFARYFRLGGIRVVPPRPELHSLVGTVRSRVEWCHGGLSSKRAKSHGFLWKLLTSTHIRFYLLDRFLQNKWFIMKLDCNLQKP